MAEMHPRDRLIVALDRGTRGEILDLIDDLHGTVGVFKIGLQAFIALGPRIVHEVIDRGQRVFLDLKIHDIPNTAKHAIEAAHDLGASMVTVHCSGGSAMLKACAREAPASSGLLVLGVTILTSLDDRAIERIGYRDSTSASVVRLAKLARSSGLRGVVASPEEIAILRRELGRDLVIVTPGIRPSGSAPGDQKRTMTPHQAIEAGADYIVVGRPITDAADPRQAAIGIVRQMASDELPAAT